MSVGIGRKPTVYPNGVNIKRARTAGGAAGSHTIDSSFGMEVGDVIHQVESTTWGSLGTMTTTVDLTSEFTSVCATANTFVNTGGTDTTDAVLTVVFFDADAGEGTL